MKKRVQNILLVCLFLFGVGVIMYPSVSEWINTRAALDEVDTYEQTLTQVTDDFKAQLLASAEAFNERILYAQVTFPFDEAEQADYDLQLVMPDTKTMAYISIPKLDVQLPIYHGTSDATLSSGVGHIEGTSLPVGGESTHAVLSGHNGLPTARLFTGLNRLVLGDYFVINTAGRVLTYQVDQILTVLPEETDALAIEPGADLCTLVTCTPYGINTHRLLVRGHRVANLTEEETSEQSVGFDWTVLAPTLIALALVISLAAYLKYTSKKKKGGEGDGKKKHADSCDIAKNNRASG